MGRGDASWQDHDHHFGKPMGSKKPPKKNEVVTGT